MFGNRGIWHRGWKAVTEHGPISGMGIFEKDRWQLFHSDVDRLKRTTWRRGIPRRCDWSALWFAGGEANNVLPLNDLRRRPPRTS